MVMQRLRLAERLIRSLADLPIDRAERTYVRTQARMYWVERKHLCEFQS